MQSIAASGAAPADGGGGVGPSSNVLDTGGGGSSRGDDAICAGALSDSRCLSEGARGVAVGKGRVAVAVGGVFVRAGSASGAATADGGGGVGPSSNGLDTGCGGSSHGDGAIGVGAHTNSRGSSEVARGAAVGASRVAVAVGGSAVCAGSAIGAAPADGGGGVGPSSNVLDTGCGGSSHGDDAICVGALSGSRCLSEGARGVAVGKGRVAVAVGGVLVRAGSASGAAPADGGGGVGPSSNVLDTGCGGSSHGDDAICVGALSDSRCLSEGARGVAVGKGRVAVAVGGVLVRAGSASGAAPADGGGGVGPSSNVLDTGGSGSSHGDDAICVGALSDSRCLSEGARGVAVGKGRIAVAVGGVLVRAGSASDAAPADGGGGVGSSSNVLDTGCGGSSHGDDAICVGALSDSRCLSEGARGVAVGKGREAVAVGGVLVRAGSASGAAPADGGGGVGPSSNVLDMGCGGSSHGDDAICVGALSDSRLSSEGARGVAVGKGRVAVAVGGVFVRAGSASGAATADSGGGVGPSSNVLATGCGGSSHDDGAICVGALSDSRCLSEGVRGAAVGASRVAVAVGESVVRAGSASGAAPADGGGGVGPSSNVLGAGCGGLSHGDGAIGASARTHLRCLSDVARWAAVGASRVAVAVGKSVVRAGSAIGAAPASGGGGIGLSSKVLDAGGGGLSHSGGAIGASARMHLRISSEVARGAAVGASRMAVAVGGSEVRAGSASDAAPASGGGGIGPSSIMRDAGGGGLSHGDDANFASARTHLRLSGDVARGAAVGTGRVAVAVCGSAVRAGSAVGVAPADGSGGGGPASNVLGGGGGSLSHGGGAISVGAHTNSRSASVVARGAAVGASRVAVAVGGSAVRAGSAIGAAPADGGGGVGPSSNVLDTGGSGASHGDDAICVGALSDSRCFSDVARGAAVGASRVAVAVGGSVVSAGSASGAAPASGGGGIGPSSKVLDAGGGGLPHGDGAIGASARTHLRLSSEVARGAAVGAGRVAVAVGGSEVRAGSAIGAAPASGGGGIGPSSKMLDAGGGGLSHGGGAIGASARTHLRLSSEVARGAVVGASRVAVAVGKSVVRAGSAISAAPASGGGGCVTSGATLGVGGGSTRGGVTIGACALRVPFVAATGRFAAFRVFLAAMGLGVAPPVFSFHDGEPEFAWEHATERAGSGGARRRRDNVRRSGRCDWASSRTAGAARSAAMTMTAAVACARTSAWRERRPQRSGGSALPLITGERGLPVIEAFGAQRTFDRRREGLDGVEAFV